MTWKRTKQILLTWVMVALMLLNIFLPLNSARAADVSPATLTNLVMTVKQDGATIPEGGTLTSTKPIRVDISFGVPVEGDDPTPANPVHQGDTASFNLGTAFTLGAGTPASIALNFGSLVVGHASFATDSGTKMVTANVVFDGDVSVFNGDSNTVSCKFGADFDYDGSGSSGTWGDHTVTILEKTFTVTVPTPPIIYTVSKTGTANLATQSIEWTVNIGATQGGSPIDLGGYQFYDDLSSVGAYIDTPATFEVDGASATADTTGSALRYTFPAGSTSPKVIKFQTKISNSQYYATSQQTVRNKAQLLNSESAVMGESQYDVKFTPQWIEKHGVASDAGSGVYDPTNRTITWTIIANHMGATLNNAVITDVLPTGLTFQSAKWQAWNGSAWGTETSVTPNGSGEYALGDINTKVLLTIVSNVPDEAYTVKSTTYSNSASIHWTGIAGADPGSGAVNVPIGFNGISKSGVADAANQKVHWTITVDTKEQSVPSATVYDLLVYGKSINLSTVTGIPAGIATADLTPQYGQKYDGNYTGVGTTVTVLPILQGSTQVADLVEITGLSSTAVNTLKFDSLVVDPDIFAGNKTTNVYNTAALFSATTKLNASTASVSYKNNSLQKTMLARAAFSDPAAGVNNSTTNATGGFDYQRKAVIFRLSVNADGIKFAEAINSAGQPLGQATVTDTLPVGWEFVTTPLPGQSTPYLIFEGTGQASGNVLASDTTPDPVPLTVDFNNTTRKATFTFTGTDTLDKPYVILFQAQPTSATAAQYFASNQTSNVTNTAKLTSANWSAGVTSSQNVSVTSQILNKTTTVPTAGELRWTVDYKPYDLTQLGQRLEDQLPTGIDLRTDSSGTLILTGGLLTANEMTLNADGSYTLGSAVELKLGENISYNNATRVLSFVLPDSAKAYRFSYLTDITGEPGAVSNKVSLMGGSTKQEQTSKSYTISSADGSASLQKNGWIRITKVNGSGAALSGAEFTLFASNGTTVIKKGVTASDGSLRFKVIPDGHYILRETAAPGGFTLEGVDHSLVVTTDGSTVTSSIDGRTGSSSNTIRIQNFTAGSAGNLTITKTVAGDGADQSKSFDFTVTLTGATDTYNYIGNGVPGGTIQSGDTVSLAHGQSITIVGLPKDATYTVTEANYASDGYTTTSTGATGTIVADATQTAAFTNTRTVGSLSISKTVAGNASSYTKAFRFTLTLTNAANVAYPYTGSGVPDGTIRSGDHVSLAHGQSITITGLPKGAGYTVAEASYASDGYSTVSTGATGTIAENTTQAAAFTNTRNLQPGSLTIVKTVAGNVGDVTKKFDFTLTLTNAANIAFPYTGNGVPNGTIRSGDTFSLAHGQSITITGLPKGAGYTVTEADYTAGGYLTASAGATGTILEDATQTAAFTNTRNLDAGSLTISKTVAGNAGDATKKFNFTLTFSGAAPIAYPYIGSGVPNGTLRSGDTVSLAHGQSITVSGLPKGATYTVTEADYTADGYTTASTGATGTIVAGETQTAAFTNTRTLDSGSLKIIKTVAGDAGEPSKKFDFTLTLTGAGSIAYSYTGNGVANGTLRSGDTFSLAHGQSITITGLPKGAIYTVTEADYSGAGYTTVSTGATGTIEAAATKTAVFTNTKDLQPGSLTISKTVTGPGTNSKRLFDFTVTFVGAPGAYAYSGSGGTGTVKSGGIISLASGQSVTITGLPQGATYTVTEADYSRDGYTAVSTGATGTISSTASQTAAFTNMRDGTLPSEEDTGILTIQKTVAGDLGDTEQPFTFEVILGATGSYRYTGSQTGTLASGQTVLLKHGESIHIEGLPVGTTYLVSEAEADQDGYVTDSSGASGTIGEAEQTAAFVNTRSSVPQTGDDNMGAVGRIGLIASVLTLLALIGLDIFLRSRRRTRRH